jgi:hypothetical protein
VRTVITWQQVLARDTDLPRSLHMPDEAPRTVVYPENARVYIVFAMSFRSVREKRSLKANMVFNEDIRSGPRACS